MTTIVVVRKGGSAVIARIRSRRSAPRAWHPRMTGIPRRSRSTATPSSESRAAPRTSWCWKTCSRARPTSTSTARPRIYESFRKLHPVLKDEAFLNPKEEEDDPYESSQMTGDDREPRRHIRRVLDARGLRVRPLLGDRLGARFRARRDVRALRPGQECRGRGDRGHPRGAEFDTGTSEPVHLHEVALR
jgi:hypothetical protein